MPPKYMSKKRVNAESDDDATSSKRVKTLSTKPMNDGEGKYWEVGDYIFLTHHLHYITDLTFSYPRIAE